METYKQQFSHGCLVACFLILLSMKKGQVPRKETEKEILIKGMDRKYEYYVVGVAEEFVKKSKEEVSVIADNEYFANKLKQSYKDEKIKIDAKKITLNLISELLKKRPVILHIDDNFLGDYSHVSHFIVLEKATKTKFLIHDPYYGKKSFVSQKKIINAVQSLKKHVKMCPLIFYI